MVPRTTEISPLKHYLYNATEEDYYCDKWFTGIFSALCSSLSNKPAYPRLLTERGSLVIHKVPVHHAATRGVRALKAFMFHSIVTTKPGRPIAPTVCLSPMSGWSLSEAEESI